MTEKSHQTEHPAPRPIGRGEGEGPLTVLRVLDILEDTTVDGPGFRTSIYLAGCRHHCPGCHNPESWNENGGGEISVDELMRVITNDPFAHVTLSGGDPLLQASGCAELARRIKAETDKTIWCYTGYTWEHLLTEDDADVMSLLQNLDVLVDGPFVQALRNTDLLFRGSSNQRLIDVQKSLRSGKVVEWRRD
ncbi:MAG: anaerobic ribonucleoside-triphosphate reductase activating protein [Bacteroidaceae bacterium]|nr:anaerobic ribonucleoside-triphosphate reductase activating protein [Bacteroidaceae bacterium]